MSHPIFLKYRLIHVLTTCVTSQNIIANDVVGLRFLP